MVLSATSRPDRGYQLREIRMIKRPITKLTALCFCMLVLACAEQTEDNTAANSLGSEAGFSDGPTNTGLAENSTAQTNLDASSQMIATGRRVQEGFNSSGRPAADADAHLNRQPDQILAWAGIQEGMEVIDLSSAGGYYAENLAWAVGLEGWVIAQNNVGTLELYGETTRATLEQRLAGGRLPQVEHYEIDFVELADEFDELHAATLINSIHDTYNNQGELVTQVLLQTIYNILGPDGFIIVIDHVGLAGQDNSELHRVDPEVIRDLLVRSGFDVQWETDILKTEGDDLSLPVFDPAVRGITSRFVFKAVKSAN